MGAGYLLRVDAERKKVAKGVGEVVELDACHHRGTHVRLGVSAVGGGGGGSSSSSSNNNNSAVFSSNTLRHVARSDSTLTSWYQRCRSRRAREKAEAGDAVSPGKCFRLVFVFGLCFGIACHESWVM